MSFLPLMVGRWWCWHWYEFFGGDGAGGGGCCVVVVQNI